jgi:hypothetical protein
MPGTLYLAKDSDSAAAIYAGLIAEGYVVKVVHAATNTEYEICDGAFLPKPFSQPPIDRTRTAADRSPA